ncbi:MAG: RNA polymerase factor sigma-54 [bacterium]
MKPFNSLVTSQELRTQLRLTPEMRLRLDVLQATHLELNDILNKELEENPLIEDIIRDEESALIEKDGPREKEKEQDLKFEKDAANFEEAGEEYYENNFEPEYYSKNEYQTEYNPELGKISDKGNIGEKEKKDLYSELLRQLNLLNVAEDIYNAGYILISNINSDGFLAYTPEEIAEASGMKKEAVYTALEIIKQFEPAGVGAMNPRESLLLQLKLSGLRDSIAYQIIDKYFELLSRQQYSKIAAAMKVSEANIKKAHDIIKGFSPYPGRNYSAGSEMYITPDIIVEENESGEYEIKIAGELPEIVINSAFLKEYKAKKQTRTFVKKYEERIKMLMQSVEERNNTIKKTAKLLLEIQNDFIRTYDPALIKPLTLKEVAEKTGVVESTISRIVSRKYIQLPGGVYSLKKFFSAKLQSSGGEISTNLVKDRIKELIDKEDKKAPLTDTRIETALKEQGIKIARRTVTKYREEMGIFQANMRKNGFNKN